MGSKYGHLTLSEQEEIIRCLALGWRLRVLACQPQHDLADYLDGPYPLAAALIVHRVLHVVTKNEWGDVMNGRSS